MQALDWAYDKAVNGVPGLDSAEEMAANYLNGAGTLIDKVNSLIFWQNSKAGTSGFLTGLGGILSMPVAIPANIASVIYIQVRMIAAIAHMGEYDLRDDRVKTLIYACLCGNAAGEVVKGIGIKLGVKITQKAINSISGKVLTSINRAVGFRLLTKFGQTGIVNFGKCIPLVGGVVGGAFDAVTTNIIGNVARNTFIGSSRVSKEPCVSAEDESAGPIVGKAGNDPCSQSTVLDVTFDASSPSDVGPELPTQQDPDLSGMQQFLSEDAKLRDEWRRSYGDGYVDFIYDGPTDPARWFNGGERILCLLKEAHGGGVWDQAEAIRNDGGLLRVGGTASQATQNRVVEWLYAIDGALNGKRVDIDADRCAGYPEARAVMLRSAWINIKKAGGVSKSDADDLRGVVERDILFLRRQFKLLSPRIVLCCGTFDLAVDLLFPDHQMIRGTSFSYRSGSVIVIDFRHPARAACESYEPLIEEIERIRKAGALSKNQT